MKIYLNVIVLLFVGLVISCSQKKSDSGIMHFENNIDEMYGWNENCRDRYLRTDKAYSGSFVNVIKKNAPYSSCFYMKMGDITAGHLKKVKAEGYALRENSGAIPVLVIDILDRNFKSIDYIVKDGKSIMKNNNQWYEIENEVPLDSKARNDPENFIKIYFANFSEGACWIDDINIRFE
jgi:hypothetical protein